MTRWRRPAARGAGKFGSMAERVTLGRINGTDKAGNAERGNRVDRSDKIDKIDRGGRWFRAQGPGFAVALLLSVVVSGALGYHLIEGLPLWEAFYVTVLEITTVNLP